MAPLTLIFAASTLVVYVFWKVLAASRRHRIPPGLKKLPGPKGMVTYVLHPPFPKPWDNGKLCE